MKKKEALEEIYNLLGSIFNSYGYFVNKSMNKYIRSEDLFKFNFCIDISSKNIQHLILTVENRTIEVLFKKAMSKMILEKNVGLLPIDKNICSLTDWKMLYIKESLNIGKIWFASISNLCEISKNKEEYITAIKIANNWFEQCLDLNYMYSYNMEKCTTRSVEIALIIGKILNKDIEKDFNNLKKTKKNYSDWSIQEIGHFLNYI